MWVTLAGGGLTATGSPNSAKVILIFRTVGNFTSSGVVTAFPGAAHAYLPPVWGWLTLVWMRHREYI